MVSKELVRIIMRVQRKIQVDIKSLFSVFSHGQF